MRFPQNKTKNGRIMRPFLLGLMTLYYSGHEVVLSLLYAIPYDIAYLVPPYQGGRGLGLTKPTLGFTLLGEKLS